jgi:hypothetical protein
VDIDMSNRYPRSSKLPTSRSPGTDTPSFLRVLIRLTAALSMRQMMPSGL